MGIGAFVYYRWVVENHTNRILEEVIKVAKKLNIPQEDMAALESTKRETQFNKAMKLYKDAIPQTLLSNGHNLLLLLLLH